MRLRIRHKTTYRYSDPASTSHHEARLTPRPSENQRTLAHELEILPEPTVRRGRLDFFGNKTTYFGLTEPHQELQVEARSLVDVTLRSDIDCDMSPAWESVRDRLASDRRRDTLQAYQLAFESTHVRFSEALLDYATPTFEPSRPILRVAQALMHKINTEFRYDPNATDVDTNLEMFLEKRRGVCQDFAHLFAGCLRSRGLAARYVSGYLLTQPPPGRPKLVGADASHAWVSVWVPEQGWIDFDPTNDLIPGERHVTVAYGRDFSDVTPVRGVILGGGQHTIQVAVDVDPVENEREV